MGGRSGRVGLGRLVPTARARTLAAMSVCLRSLVATSSVLVCLGLVCAQQPAPTPGLEEHHVALEAQVRGALVGKPTADATAWLQGAPEIGRAHV